MPEIDHNLRIHPTDDHSWLEKVFIADNFISEILNDFDIFQSKDGFIRFVRL